MHNHIGNAYTSRWASNPDDPGLAKACPTPSLLRLTPQYSGFLNQGVAKIYKLTGVVWGAVERGGGEHKTATSGDEVANWKGCGSSSGGRSQGYARLI